MLRLCSVKIRAKAQSENWVISIARTRCPETQCSLFPICCRFPKLDVAGSSPVSRSKINNLEAIENLPLHCTTLSIQFTKTDSSSCRAASARAPVVVFV